MSSFAYPEGTAPVSSKPAVCAKIRGVGTAIVTPFAGENAATVDYDSLTNLVDAQLAGGLFRRGEQRASMGSCAGAI